MNSRFSEQIIRGLGSDQSASQTVPISARAAWQMAARFNFLRDRHRPEDLDAGASLHQFRNIWEAERIAMAYSSTAVPCRAFISGWYILGARSSLTAHFPPWQVRITTYNCRGCPCRTGLANSAGSVFALAGEISPAANHYFPIMRQSNEEDKRLHEKSSCWWGGIT